MCKKNVSDDITLFTGKVSFWSGTQHEVRLTVKIGLNILTSLGSPLKKFDPQAIQKVSIEYSDQTAQKYRLVCVFNGCIWQLVPFAGHNSFQLTWAIPVWKVLLNFLTFCIQVNSRLSSQRICNWMQMSDLSLFSQLKLPIPLIRLRSCHIQVNRSKGMAKILRVIRSST